MFFLMSPVEETRRCAFSWDGWRRHLAAAGGYRSRPSDFVSAQLAHLEISPKNYPQRDNEYSPLRQLRTHEIGFRTLHLIQ